MPSLEERMAALLSSKRGSTPPPPAPVRTPRSTVPRAPTPSPDPRPGAVAPHVQNVRTAADYPKKWTAPPELASPVWYKGERWFVCNTGLDWERTSFVQIMDCPYRPGMSVPKGATVQSVHADLLEPAPISKTAYHPQMKKATVEKRAEMKAKGLTDIGDDVAVMLRGKSLDEVYEIAAKFLGKTNKELTDKYSHLNCGMQRMVIGGAMRNHLKKGRR